LETSLKPEERLKMVKYICLCMFAPDFLKQDLEQRQSHIPKWSEIATTYGLKLLFWGPAMGVKEHAVFVFDSNGNTAKFFKFQREWLQLGTPEAGKYIEYMKTITVH
jgi:hypothetical protein